MTGRPRHGNRILLPPRREEDGRRRFPRPSPSTDVVGQFVAVIRRLAAVIVRWVKSKRDELSKPIDPTMLNEHADEAYRRVVNALRQGGMPGSGKVVLVVSAVHGEGGSSVSKNLARTLARVSRNRVLLIDANPRSPSQHLKSGVQASPGLADVTADAQDVQTVALATSDAGYALLPAGQAQDDPIHSMREDNLGASFGELSKNYDWIVVDGPPVTKYAEASTLSSLADATVLVIRAESTRAEVVERAKRTLLESGADLYGVILNRREYHIPDFIYRWL